MNAIPNLPEPTYRLRMAFISFKKTFELLKNLVILIKKFLML
jgi:hypothetical protein